jgi:hypothetical protein
MRNKGPWQSILLPQPSKTSAANGFRVSMSGNANRYNNAAVETSFKTLKNRTDLAPH